MLSVRVPLWVLWRSSPRLLLCPGNDRSVSEVGANWVQGLIPSDGTFLLGHPALCSYQEDGILAPSIGHHFQRGAVSLVYLATHFADESWCLLSTTSQATEWTRFSSQLHSSLVLFELPYRQTDIPRLPKGLRTCSPRPDLACSRPATAGRSSSRRRSSNSSVVLAVRGQVPRLGRVRRSLQHLKAEFIVVTSRHSVLPPSVAGCAARIGEALARHRHELPVIAGGAERQL